MTSEEIAAVYKETLDKAVKLRKKPEDNMMLIEVGYGNKCVFPHADGLKFIESIKNAEALVEDYNKPPRIEPIDRARFVISMLSSHEYNQIKMASLLGVTLNEIKEAEKACREATYQPK